jgi:hypothetical protein
MSAGGLTAAAYGALVDAARKKQFTHIEVARAQLLSWATANDVPLARVEFVVPFVETDHGLHVWLFYDTDLNVGQLNEDGTTASVQREFLSILHVDGYPTDWLHDVAFSIDPHESVERNFEGNYFYRLR